MTVRFAFVMVKLLCKKGNISNAPQLRKNLEFELVEEKKQKIKIKTKNKNKNKINKYSNK
jgi:hypothetical protein